MSLATMQNKQINGLIFDLDGVIADTAHLHYRAWCQIASRWGFYLTEEQNEQLKGGVEMTPSKNYSLYKKIFQKGI